MFLPTAPESAALDRWATLERGVPSTLLMENAGRSATLVLERIFPEGPVLVAAGPGNNGGDGMVLARTLAAHGRDVRVIIVGSRPAPDPLLHGWPVPIQRLSDDDEPLDTALRSAGVLVDALLGTGARGEPRAEHARVIQAMNSSGRPVLALDVPSGVDASSGAVPGMAIRAQVTVALGSPKLGTLLFPARELAGRIVAVEIGFPPPATGWASARLLTPDWARARRPQQRRNPTHKKAEGWLLILAGSPGMAGAAVLAARGALRAGAGYVQVASPPENRSVIQAAVPEAIFLDVSDEDRLLDAARSCDALAAGPGMGTGPVEAKRLDRLLSLPDLGGVVLDADALTLLGEGRLPGLATAPIGRRLLTPHPGEMARLGEMAERVRKSPLDACRSGAARWHSTVLLKGAPSVVAEDGEGPVWVSATGSSDLARAGMGDVLTGVAGAFMARGLGGLEAAGVALHYTGRAASATGLGETLLPSDVAEQLSGALNEEEASSDLGYPFVTLDLDPPR
ncbi:MAG: NAD(P)H-hydrate dehydratase [Gemmatimonadetes bacterium]|nr:NAD(P)H-hydrate dehydratase [Gemmatimonadota bacterium]